MNSSGKHPNPASDNVTDDFEVGYAKPPKRTRFRPGQSGNPAGRRKKVAQSSDRRPAHPESAAEGESE